ncbi:MAG: hypothetical protein JWM19_923 [Actinomycetia bacterium]|nr:hypothetical protein [Actinomycetes bacterium]
MTEPASVRLLDRLRLEGIIPATADCVLQRRYRNGTTLRRGAWSWQVSWSDDGLVPVRVAVSRFPMSLCASAGRWSVAGVWLSSHGCPGQVIFPEAAETRRR